MIAFLIAVIKVLIILCIVATIHELGHFLAAKFFKVGVKEFSIGFGKKIFQKEYKETLYSLRCLPLGGYVMIEGEGEESDSPNSFSKQNGFVKCVILVMGVVFNLILATAILIGISFSYGTATTTIDSLDTDSILTEYGITSGDTITKINGDKVYLASELIETKYADESTTIIEYERDGVTNEITLDNATLNIGQIGVAFIIPEEATSTTTIDTIYPGMPADDSGLKEKDEILSINGNEVTTSTEIISIVSESANVELVFEILRDGEILEKTVTPEETKIFDLGISSTNVVSTDFKYAFLKTSNTIEAVVVSYVDIFKGEVSIDDVSSVVGIGNVVSKAEDFLQYLNLLALISLAIGAANLLPFLPLDGGKIVLVIIEEITRKKVPENVELTISYICFGALMLLTVIVTFKDIIRLI